MHRHDRVLGPRVGHAHCRPQPPDPVSWLTRDTAALALDEYDVRARFDGVSAGSVGLEEEVLFVDPETLLPVPAADAIVTAAADARIKRELAACQGELI